MNASMLKNKITIQKKEAVADDIGRISEKWSDFMAVHAYANRLSGQELIVAAANGQQDTVTFSVRYCSKLSKLNGNDFRIVFMGRVFNILTVDNVMFLNKELKIRAVEEDGRV
jgi:SPP1 family predicted phage head-tail adaptor